MSSLTLRTAVGLALLASVAGCATSPAEGRSTPAPHAQSASAPLASTPPTNLPSASAPAVGRSGGTDGGCAVVAAGFDCDLQHRFAATEAYLRSRPGTVGIVLRDRRTGAVWRNAYATRPVWTASTIKLAMTVDLLLRDRAGRIHLVAADRELIRRMLNVSDDDAADALWHKFGRADFKTRFPTYGLTGATFVPGFQRYWGWMKCTPNDLDRLMSYVLERLPAELRGYVVGQLRRVAPIQQWGVWGAGAAARPGNKDGWSSEQGGWVINSVGFVGPGERYTLSMMNSLDGKGGYAEGVATITHVAGLLFAGRF